MSYNKVINRTEILLNPILEEEKLTLFDIVFLKEGSNWYLRIFIDKEGGVDINDCEVVSRKIEVFLDKEDFIEQSYILEVSSPGIDRPIRNKEDFKQFSGEIIDVKLYKAKNKQKDFQGELVGLINDKIVMKIEDTRVEFDREEVATCKLAVIF